MMTSDERKLGFLMDEVSVSLVFTSIMAMAAFVLLGFILQAEESTLSTLKFPLVYIFISAIAFIYATNIYANVSGGISRLGDITPDKQLCLGNIIAEIYGYYLILFSLPMAIYAYIDDSFIVFSVFLINIAAIWLYSQSQYSILYRYFKNRAQYFVSSIMIAVYTINFLTLIRGPESHIFYSSILLLATLTVIFVYMHGLDESLLD